MNKFKVGDKVKILCKTRGVARPSGATGLTIGGYGYVTKIYEDHYVLDSDKDSMFGDYFNEGDLEMAEREFTHGELVVDDEGREYLYVGKNHNGNYVVEDKYDGTYDVRRYDEEELGELKRASEIIKEVTLEEIAKKFNIPVEQLRIKD